MSAGWEFPVRISGEHGRVAISRDKENIRQSVKIILLTEPGERLLHQEFGTKLHQFLFESMDSQTEEMIRREVCHALYRWETRITDIEVMPDTEHHRQGELRINVSYRIAELEETDQIEIALGDEEQKTRWINGITG